MIQKKQRLDASARKDRNQFKTAVAWPSIWLLQNICCWRYFFATRLQGLRRCASFGRVGGRSKKRDLSVGREIETCVCACLAGETINKKGRDALRGKLAFHTKKRSRNFIFP